jgi:hypothetical protein
MSQPELSGEEGRWTAEVLRRASAVLHGRMVGVWEVSPQESLVPVATNSTEILAWDATPEVEEALLRVALPAAPGARWVAGRMSGLGQWCVAPVRHQVPAPPPNDRERRSRERLAMELAGLCLGLRARGSNGAATESAAPDLFQRFTEQLGAFAYDIGAPLAAARAAVARSGSALASTAQGDGAQRDKLVDELRRAAKALEQAVTLVRTVQERARAVIATGENLDVVRVVWSCVDAERAPAALHGAALELKTLAYVVSIPGSADEFYKVVVAAIRAAVECLQGRGGTVKVTVENVGPVVRLVVRTPAVGGLDAHAPPMVTARSIVEKNFGGTLTVTSPTVEGTALIVSVPVPSHRFRDPALWWEA